MKPNNTDELVREYCRTKRAELRDLIVFQLSGLVESLARRFIGSGEPLEDLVQEGYLGLLNALELFDPEKGVKFTTYAAYLIVGQIKHFLRDKGKIIKQPAWLQELNQKISRVVHELTQQHGQPPTVSQIAEFLGMSPQAVEEVLTTREVFKVASLDAIDEEEEGEGGYDLDKLRQQERLETFELPVEERLVLETAMQQLKQIEQQVLHLFFYEEMNQTEIAQQLKISCNYVSHILRNATQKLRRILIEEERLEQQKRWCSAQQTDDFEGRILDPHTGLYSRLYCQARLQEEVQRATRYGAPVALALFEFTHLEPLHRSFGEFTLSELMVQAAEEVRSLIRKADLMVRFDTYTLGLLLPHAGDAIPQIAERVLTRLRKWFRSLFAGSSFCVEVYTGWAIFPTDGERAEQLEAIALQRLQAAKEAQEIPTAA